MSAPGYVLILTLITFDLKHLGSRMKFIVCIRYRPEQKFVFGSHNNKLQMMTTCHTVITNTHTCQHAHSHPHSCKDKPKICSLPSKDRDNTCPVTQIKETKTMNSKSQQNYVKMKNTVSIRPAHRAHTARNCFLNSPQSMGTGIIQPV